MSETNKAMSDTNTAIPGTLAELLETMQRPGLLGVAGKAVQKRCQKDLTSYFAALGKRISEMKFEDLADVNRGVSGEHARHAVGMRMHNLLRSRRPLLNAMLHANIVSAIAQANKTHVLAEADGDDAPQKPGMTAEQAAAYAQLHAGELVTGLDATTLKTVADAVAYGIEQRLGVAGTAHLIKELVAGMSTSRAETIATTEMADAMSQAFLKKLSNNDVEYKQWILGPDPCEVCIDNADASPIPVDEDFPSGDDAPPAHPNCVCALAGARGPGGDF
jgi:hypothetical protein